VRGCSASPCSSVRGDPYRTGVMAAQVSGVPRVVRSVHVHAADVATTVVLVGLDVAQFGASLAMPREPNGLSFYVGPGEAVCGI
jgi:hypothetical protein